MIEPHVTETHRHGHGHYHAEPMVGPLIPAQSHTLACWRLPRSGRDGNPAPQDGACDCPLITGHAYPRKRND